MFVNSFTPNDKYSRDNGENFQQQIQIQLSPKLKAFFGLYIAFLKSTSNLEYFEIKDESHSLSISDIMDSEIGGYLHV